MQGSHATGGVLVVEDDREVSKVIALSLGDDCEVRHATTGAEALDVVRREPVAVVVLDYRLPDRTGLEVLREIRSAQPSMPVIMITGYGSEAICASAFKLGARDYFWKPFNVSELRRSVRRILSPEGSGAQETRPNRERERWVALPSPRQPNIGVQKAAALIRQRYWDHLTLSDLAREVGMSKYWLSHRFRELIGVTLRSYLVRVRLERAKDLLATSGLHVTEVAQAVGFGDLPRFDKLFKRYTGITPSAYRDRVARGEIA